MKHPSLTQYEYNFKDYTRFIKITEYKLSLTRRTLFDFLREIAQLNDRKKIIFVLLIFCEGNPTMTQWFPLLATVTRTALPCDNNITVCHVLIQRMIIKIWFTCRNHENRVKTRNAILGEVDVQVRFAPFKIGDDSKPVQISKINKLSHVSSLILRITIMLHHNFIIKSGISHWLEIGHDAMVSALCCFGLTIHKN